MPEALDRCCRKHRWLWKVEGESVGLVSEHIIYIAACDALCSLAEVTGAPPGGRVCAEYFALYIDKPKSARQHTRALVQACAPYVPLGHGTYKPWYVQTGDGAIGRLDC